VAAVAFGVLTPAFGFYLYSAQITQESAPWWPLTFALIGPAAAVVLDRSTASTTRRPLSPPAR
jgi:hypothetical protein